METDQQETMETDTITEQRSSPEYDHQSKSSEDDSSHIGNNMTDSGKHVTFPDSVDLMESEETETQPSSPNQGTNAHYMTLTEGSPGIVQSNWETQSQSADDGTVSDHRGEDTPVHNTQDPVKGSNVPETLDSHTPSLSTNSGQSPPAESENNSPNGREQNLSHRFQDSVNVTSPVKQDLKGDQKNEEDEKNGNGPKKNVSVSLQMPGSIQDKSGDTTQICVPPGDGSDQEQSVNEAGDRKSSEEGGKEEDNSCKCKNGIMFTIITTLFPIECL